MRNFLREEMASFLGLCEYTDRADAARARSYFFDRRKQVWGVGWQVQGQRQSRRSMRCWETTLKHVTFHAPQPSQLPPFSTGQLLHGVGACCQAGGD